MSTTPNLEPVLSFLDNLSQNNNKPWFDQNRPAYEAARSAFEQFVDGVIDQFREVDNLQGLAARECMPRINRDVRLYGKDMIVRIVRECTDGNVLSITGEDTTSLEARWMKWLLDERLPALAPD